MSGKEGKTALSRGEGMERSGIASRRTDEGGTTEVDLRVVLRGEGTKVFFLQKKPVPQPCVERG